MFTLLELRKSKQFSLQQTVYLRQLLIQYRKTPQGCWLWDIPIHQFQFYWCPAMSVTNGVLGAFTPFYSYKIFTMPQQQAVEELSQFYIELMFPTIVHQLRHAWQYMYRDGILLYMLKSLPVVRQFTIQVQADTQTGKAQTWLASYLKDKNQTRPL